MSRNTQEEKSLDFELDKGFRIGDWDASPRQLTLSRGGERHRLEPKVMAVLVCLAEHAGDVVTRDEFAQAVWKDRIVSDEVLSRNISLLRSQLGDDVREPRFIQTIPGRGYRLIVPVEEPRKSRVSSDQLSRRLWVMVVGVMLAAMVLGLWLGSIESRLDPKTIVVLPFKNLCGGNVYFSDGLTEEILGALTYVPELKVIAGTTTFLITEDDASSIGTQLLAGSILTGSVCQEEGRLKVTARMEDTNDGLLLWSENYERTMEDVFKIQNDISDAVVEKLVGTLNITTPAVTTTDIETYNLYLRARHQFRRRGEASLLLSIDLFKQAIERDSEFEKAYVGLAEAYSILLDYTDQDEEPLLELAMAALTKAQQMGAEQSRSHALLGQIHRKQGEWLDAEREFSLALEGSPDSEVFHWHSLLLAQLGYMSEAREASRRSVELSPLSPVVNQRLAILSFWAGDIVDATKYYTIADQQGLGKDAIPEAYAAVLLSQGKFAEATAALKATQISRGLSSTWIDPVIGGIRGDTDLATAVDSLDLAHEQGLLSQTSYVGALYFLGANDRLVDVLLGFQSAGIQVQAFEVVFAEGARKVREHERFGELVDQAGLVEYWQARTWPPVCRWNGVEAECH